MRCILPGCFISTPYAVISVLTADADFYDYYLENEFITKSDYSLSRFKEVYSKWEIGNLD